MKYFVGASPEEVPNTIRGLEQLSSGQADTGGVVQEGEEEVKWRLQSTFHHLKGATREGLLTRAWSVTGQEETA